MQLARPHRPSGARDLDSAPRRGARRWRSPRSRPRTTATGATRTRAPTGSPPRATTPRRSRRDLGGMGVDCLHDVVVASSRLARADASLAIGVNMHMAALLEHGAACTARGAGEARAPRSSGIARDGVRHGAPRSPSPARTSPARARSRPARADGWRIDGRKLFCTGSPGRDRPLHLGFVRRGGRRGALRLRDGAGRRRRRHRARRLGRARHARLRAATPSRSTPWRSPQQPCAAASPSATPTATCPAT